jgi:hypothetical protein
MSQSKSKQDPRRKKQEEPAILEIEKADRRDRPNTCRQCADSKFC